MALNITKERAAELARNVNDPDSPGYEDALKMVNMLKATPDANGYYHPETIERLLYSRDEKNVQDQMLPILREKKAKLEEEKDNSLLYHAQKNKSKTVNVSKTELKYGNKKEDVGLSIRKIEPLMEKGSKEATELRDLLATYLEAVNARQQVSFEKKQKLFETAANYLHLKSGVPSTKYGQDRVNAAGEVMLKIGRNLLQTATPEQAEKIRKEISMQCYRNPQYKKQAVKAAKADLNNAIKNNISIKDDPNLRYSLSLALMDEYTELTFGTKEGHYNQKVDNPKDLAYLENIMQFGDEISQGFLDKVLTQKDPNKDIEKFLKSLEPAKKLEAPSIEIKVPSLEKDLL